MTDTTNPHPAPGQDRATDQPRSVPREQRGDSKPVGPGPSGMTQTDDQDNLHNNVSNVEASEPSDDKRS